MSLDDFRPVRGPGLLDRDMSVNRITELRVPSTDGDSFLPQISLGQVLRDLFDKLRRRWRLLAGFVGAAALLSIFYVLNATPVYTANGALLIDPRVGQNPGDTQQISPALLISDALTVDSELRVLTSREVTNSTVVALDIQPGEPTGPGLRQRLTDLLGLGGADDTDGPLLNEADRMARATEARRRNFVRDMRVARAGDSFVIDVSYTSPDPGFAATAVNALMQEYLRASGQQQVSLIERNRTWLESRIEALESDVESAEAAVTEFRSENDLLRPEGGLLPIEIALNAAVEDLVRLRGEAVAVKVQVEQLGEQIEAGSIDAVRLPVEVRSAALDGFEEAYAELQQQEKELLLSWDETAQVVRNVRLNLEQTRNLIIGEYRQAVEQIATTGDQLNRQVTAVEQVIEDLRTEYGEDARNTVVLRNMEREAEAKRTLYERLLEEYNSTSQLLTFDATSARVIAWAVPPDKKSAPQSRQIVVLAVFAGLVLAVTVVMLLEALDGSFRKQGEIARELGVRFLGVVPTFGSDTDARGPLRGLLPAVLTSRREGRWSSLPRAAQTIDFAATHPTSHAADTMRMVHAQLSLKRPDLTGSPDQGLMIGITSSVRGEGKTMTSANLATFLAGRHERVVLVDLDLITRQLSRLIGPILPDSNNLSCFIDAKDGAVSRIEGIEELPGLAVIGNTDDKVVDYVTPRTVELLEEMFAELRANFDYVIVDLPPAQGTADTQLLAALCDTLIYVVRWGKTPRDQVVSSLRQRGLNKMQIFGVLFTQAPIERYRFYNRHDVNEYYA